LAWKSSLKVPLLLLGPSCPLKTILLSNQVLCDSLLQIVMVIKVNSGLPHPNNKLKIQKNGRNGHLQQSCHTRLDGQHCPLRTYHGVFFSRAEKPLRTQHGIYLTLMHGSSGTFRKCLPALKIPPWATDKMFPSPDVLSSAIQSGRRNPV
jgi:hypothetical protein